MVKLFTKNSNLCDHNSPTLQTDRRTDGQTDDMRSQYRVLHYSASRGNQGAIYHLYDHAVTSLRLYWICNNLAVGYIPSLPPLFIPNMATVTVCTKFQINRQLWQPTNSSISYDLKITEQWPAGLWFSHFLSLSRPQTHIGAFRAQKMRQDTSGEILPAGQFGRKLLPLPL